MIKEDVLKVFRKKNILVTGGTGLIGRQAVDILCTADAHVKVVSLDNIRLNKKAEYKVADLADFGLCKEVTKDMDFVFHLAGVGASVKAAEEKMATHLVPMLMVNTNVLEACRVNRVPKVVFTSSVGAYSKGEVFRESEYRMESEPLDFASWAKRMAEAQIYAYKVEHGLENFSIVRPSNVYGPGDNFGEEGSLVIPSLIYRICNKERPLIVWGDGSAIRDFVYSRDVAEGIILALHYGTRSGFVNLGSGRPYSIKELVETLRTFLDFEYLFDASKPTGAKRRVMDISLAKELIHYNPTTDLLEGLKKTWQWYEKHPDEHLKKMNYFSKQNERAHAHRF
ncbi:MAG: NAD(P)-dependent oxidoreductase [Candidatus Omnitrophica bacterium]|nr:NAD(P)-dependent oxidoreductase [Candidatus Omnitrophota bacterium]